MKLHLPKLLLTAVLAACMSNTTAWGGGTGWGEPMSGSGILGTVLYVGPDGEQGVNRDDGLEELSWADGNTTTIQKAYTTYDSDLTVLTIAPDYDNNQSVIGNIGELIINNNSSLNIGSSGWGTGKVFSLLTIDKVTIADGGTATFNVETNQNAKVVGIDGKFSKVDVSGSLAVTSADTIGKMDAITVKSGGILDLTAVDSQVIVNYDTPTAIVDDFTLINDNAKYITEANGYIKVAFNHSNSKELKLISDTTQKKNIIAEGALVIHGNAQSKKYTIGEGVSLIANGSSNDLTGLEAINTGYIEITGGSVETSKLTLGHTDWGGDYWGKLTMIDGKLKIGSIEFRHNHSNVFSVTGGELEFTSANVLNHWSNTKATINILGTSADERVVLKANSCDWTLNALGTKPDSPGVVPTTIGNVTIAAGNKYDITLANVALSGSIVNNADLTLDSGVYVATGDEVTISGNGSTYICKTFSNSGSLSLTGNVIMGGIASDFELKTAGASTHVLDANNTGATNTDGNGFVYTSGTEYWLTKGGENEVANGITITDARNNMFALQVSTATGETGIYFSTGEGYVDTSKFYVKSGNVSVVGTGAENATGADSYILQGGTMQLTGGTVKTSEIVYSSGNVHLHKEATIVLDNLEKLETNTVSGAYTNVFDGTMYSGSGTLEFQLHENNGRGLDLSNFEGSIVVSKASGETYGRLQVNSSILHENATITLSDDAELVFNSDNVTLSNALTVKGNSQLHVNSTHKATITSAIDGGGTLIKVGNNSTLNLNGNISVGLFQTNGGTTNVIGGSVTNLKANGGTTNIQAGTLTNLSIAGGTTYVTGGKITDIAYTNNGTVNFNLAQGVESSKLSVDNIILTTANSSDYYNRHINVASGVTLTVGEIKNQWGMGTIDVDGALTAETITMTSGGDGEDKNVITGDGQITTDSLVITNAGNYRVSAATLTINNELKQDKATISQYGGTINVEGSLNSSGGNINQHGGTINVNGLLNNTGATMNLFGGQMNVNNTEGINKIYKLDMAGDNDRNSKLNLAAGSALEVSSNFWLGGTSVITLNEGATLSKDGMTITGKGTSSTITRLTAGDSNDFYASSDDHEIKNSAVSITKESENGNTLALKLTNSSVANDSTSRLVVSNTANTLTGVYANKGVLALTGLAELQLQDLVVKSGATLSVGANNNGVVMVGSPVAPASTTVSTPSAKLEGGATINGSLNLRNASSLTLNGIGEDSLVNITGNLILPGASETPTLTLSGDILSSLNAMNQGETLGIFSVHGGFFVGNQETAALDATNGIALNTVFSAGEGYNFEGYYLGFIPDEAGYSTVYIGKIVPEPTTATLSLLALAALAARRRRASR